MYTAYRSSYDHIKQEFDEYNSMLTEAISGKDVIASPEEFLEIFHNLASQAKALAQQIQSTNRELKDKSTRVMFAATKHKPASQYSRAKHVRGTTNEQRETSASNSAQYYATDEQGNRVDDRRIKQWEREALQKGVIDPDRAEGTYHVYHTFPHNVGYESPSQNETSSVRVEYSAGETHSHPREAPSNVKKLLKDKRG
jgi:hypothetical protein